MGRAEELDLRKAELSCPSACGKSICAWNTVLQAPLPAAFFRETYGFANVLLTISPVRGIKKLSLSGLWVPGAVSGRV
jgi:hypothetical protein